MQVPEPPDKRRERLHRPKRSTAFTCVQEDSFSKLQRPLLPARQRILAQVEVVVVVGAHLGGCHQQRAGRRARVADEHLRGLERLRGHPHGVQPPGRGHGPARARPDEHRAVEDHEQQVHAGLAGQGDARLRLHRLPEHLDVGRLAVLPRSAGHPGLHRAPLAEAVDERRHLVRPHVLPGHHVGRRRQALGVLGDQVRVLQQHTGVVALRTVLPGLGDDVWCPGNPGLPGEDGHDVLGRLLFDVLVGVADARGADDEVPGLQHHGVLALHAPGDLPAAVERHEDLDGPVHVEGVAVTGGHEVVRHVVAHLLLEGHGRVGVGDNVPEVELRQAPAPRDVGVEDRGVELRHLRVARHLDALLRGLLRRALRGLGVHRHRLRQRDAVRDHVDLCRELVQLRVELRLLGRALQRLLQQIEEAAEAHRGAGGRRGARRRGHGRHGGAVVWVPMGQH
mmetsp:Transcript_108100/g.328580  ORF Transcript_108100/g.328580 Transcript_108100/m.328580 type:complete len:451 (+) Transcript_108100:521-1873(+)